MNDRDVEFWFRYEREHPLREKINPEPRVGEPIQISAELGIGCNQEFADSDAPCPNVAVWECGYGVYVCSDCHEKFWCE
jgi:hypothetical protein